jgi:hypothetical protein
MDGVTAIPRRAKKMHTFSPSGSPQITTTITNSPHPGSISSMHVFFASGSPAGSDASGSPAGSDSALFPHSMSLGCGTSFPAIMFFGGMKRKEKTCRYMLKVTS